MSHEIDRVLAKPADVCCLRGSFHSGKPQGKIKQIGGVDSYIATPLSETANGNVLLYFPDAFGLHNNSFLLMDAFASCGYLTLGVDYFLGVLKSVAPNFWHMLTSGAGCCIKAHYVTPQRSQF